MTAKGRFLQVLTIAALLFAVTAKTGLTQQPFTPTNSLSRSASAEPPGTLARSVQILSLLTVWASMPISFYGKVVDGAGNPVPDAKAVMVPEQSLTGPISHYEKLSDAQGLFSVTGIHGMRLQVTVSKQGYYQPPEAKQIIGYTKEMNNFNPHSNPNNPAIFVLRKMGQTEPLITHSWRQAAVAKNGVPTTLDLYSGKNSPNGDSIQVEIWTQKTQNPNAPNPFAWKSRLTVPGGCLQNRASDPYNFQAPADGYVSEDIINMTETSSNWRTRLTRDYYFKFSDGRYARATVGYYIGGFQFVSVTSYLNPQPGHTNLEYDTNQASATTSSVHP